MGVLHRDRRVMDPTEVPTGNGPAASEHAAPALAPTPPTRRWRRHRRLPASDRPGARTHRRLGLVGLVVSFALVAVVAVLGSSWTDTGPGTWYDRLEKPGWTPPGWLFGAVWTALYAAMAVAAWLVARRGLRRPLVLSALALYGCQLVLNLGWTWTFFHHQRPAWALVEIGALGLVTAATIEAFWKVRRSAAALLVPLFGWVCFAAALNAWIVVQN